MRIGILNSGGDCPGLNAVIHGAVSAAAKLGWEVVGFRDGFEGSLPPGNYMMVDPARTVGIMKLGGTILGTTNKGHFVAKIGEGNVAEGAHWETGEIVTKERVGEKGEDRLGGIGDRVSIAVEKLTGKETRSCTLLGHLQRGGAPTSLDRILGLCFGVKAVQLIMDGDFGKMVSYQQYHVGAVPIQDAVMKLRLVANDSEIVQAARAIGVSFGDDPKA